MVGFPSQTEKELRKECLFLKEHYHYGNVGWSPFALLKGSFVFNNPDKYGVAIRSQKVLFKIKNTVVHSPIFNFVPKKGLSADIAMKIVNNEVLAKSKSHATFDEITEVIFCTTKFRIADIDIKTNHFKNYISFAIKALKINKSKMAEDYRHFLLGVSYKQLNQFKQAVTEFENAEKIANEKKFKAKIHFLLGESYERIGNYRKTINSYEKASNLFLDNGAIYLGLARAHFNVKKYEEAIKKANKAMELNYREGNIHLLLGFCYERMKKYKKAIDELKIAEKENPKEAQINFSLFNCYRNIGQTEQAHKELDKGYIKLKSSDRPRTKGLKNKCS